MVFSRLQFPDATFVAALRFTFVTPIVNDDTLFSTLKKNRIFVLPDQKDLTLKSGVDDGNEYILTFKAGNKFRSYEFNNPDLYLVSNKKVSELENYVNIINILFNWLRQE